MAVATRKEFIACVAKSTVIPADQLKQWLDGVDDTDPMKIASKLVRDKMLTPWQAKFLISGRSRLRVGNYILQTRTSSDELGDKFEAYHASLNRKVIIQFFPTSIAKNEDLLEKLLTKLRQITELDHQNLVHIYDVDQEGERYFLITEFVEGQFLADVPLEDLDDTKIALITQGIAAGLSYAHESKIIHGNVTNKNIILTPDGKAKLEGFPASTLLNEINKDPNAPPKVQSEATDFKHLAIAALSLLKNLPAADRSDQFDTIVNLIRQIGKSQTPGPKVEQLNEWVAQNVAEEPNLLDDDEETGFDSLDFSPGDLGSVKTKASPQNKQNATSADEEVVRKPKSNHIVAKLWRQHRPAFFAFASAILLAIGCVIGLLIYALSPSDVEIARRNSPLAEVMNTSQDESTSKDDSEAAEAITNSSVDYTGDHLDPEANRKRLAEFFAKQKREKEEADKAADDKTAGKEANTSTPQAPEKEMEQKTPEEKTTDEMAATETPDDTDDVDDNDVAIENTDDTDVEEMTADEELAADESSDDESSDDEKMADEDDAEPEPSPTEIASTEADGTDDDQATEPEPKPEVFKDPFKEMVKQIDLPESTNTEDVVLSELIIKKNHLLGIDLISGPEISRSKFELMLARSDDDNQLWNLAIQSKRDDPVSIAQFQKTPEELKFRWLPAAAENENANYLRNCNLKLTTPDNTGYLGLRTPITIEGLRLTEDKASVKTEVAAQWLPNPSALKIELKPFSTGNKSDDVILNPQEITKRNPGRVFFKSGEEGQFFSIDVTADTRKDIRLTAQMTLSLPNTKPKSLRSKTDLDNFLSLMEAKKNTAFSINQQAQMTKKRPENMSKDDFNRLKDEANTNAEKVNEAFVLAAEYVEIGKRLADIEIPVKIYFEMNDIPIIIAETAPQN